MAGTTPTHFPGYVAFEDSNEHVQSLRQHEVPFVQTFLQSSQTMDVQEPEGLTWDQARDAIWILQNSSGH